jgi:ribose transport system substrate-binding protein
VQRQKGLTDAFSASPKIKLAQIVDIQGDPHVAHDAAKSILQKGADKVDAFVCLEAIACPEVAAALAEQKVTGKLVVAMDTDPRTLDGIKKGFISATIAQKPYTMAYVGLHMLNDLSHSKPSNLDRPWAADSFAPVPIAIDTGVTLINNANVDNYLNENGNGGEQH